ncbi:MAG: RND family efflux transporter MFP subunit [Oceanicoccus sp.]|jgi:RND family efflux transporter MFP subunit
MGSRWLRRLLPIGIIAATVLFVAVLMAMQSPPEIQPQVQPRPNVEVSTVQFSPLALQVNSQGTVGTSLRIEWASKVTGRVIWVAPEFVEGAEVAAGSTLLKLDATDYRVAVAEAEANLADANLALTEEKSVLRRGSAYRAQSNSSVTVSLREPKLRQVESRVNAASEKLKQAQADLAATEIRAPYAAVIDNKQVDLGQFVSSGAVLFTLLGVDIAEIRLPVTANDIRFIQPINPQTELAKVVLRADFGSQQLQWQGELVRIERRVDTDTRTFFVVAQVAKPYNKKRHDNVLSMGLFVDAIIAGMSVESAVRVPRNAMHENQYVYLVVDNKLKRQPVEVLRREQQSVVVIGGLKDGDQLVLTKLDIMIDGMLVSPFATGASNTLNLSDSTASEMTAPEAIVSEATANE